MSYIVILKSVLEQEKHSSLVGPFGQEEEHMEYKTTLFISYIVLILRYVLGHRVSRVKEGI